MSTIGCIFLMSFMATILGSCSTVLVGKEQWIYVSSNCKKIQLNRSCTLSNEWDVWSFETPSRLLIKLSSKPLLFNCENELFENRISVVSTSPSLETFGNIILGGIVGVATDIGNENAFSIHRM